MGMEKSSFYVPTEREEKAQLIMWQQQDMLMLI